MAATQKELSASDVAVNAAFEGYPTNLGEYMRSDKRDGWTKAMEEEIEHFNITTSVKLSIENLGQMHCTPSGSTRPRLTCKASLSG